MSDIVNPWFSWVQTALLILAVLVFLYRPCVVKSTLQAFFSQSGRRYEDNAGDRLPDIMGYVFYLATMTMAVACGFQQIRHGHINLSGPLFGMIGLLVLGMDSLRLLMMRIVYWIYSVPMPWREVIKSYSDLRFVTGLVLWTYLLVLPYLSAVPAIAIPCVLALVYLAALYKRWHPQSGITLQSTAYALLYAIHLELVPIAAMVAGTAYILR